eukprot:Sspe_Gene.84304::Locus_55335_Transcript_2_3_Confidence_0.273_Length_2039::g.84304::m.84304
MGEGGEHQGGPPPAVHPRHPKRRPADEFPASTECPQRQHCSYPQQSEGQVQDASVPQRHAFDLGACCLHSVRLSLCHAAWEAEPPLRDGGCEWRAPCQSRWHRVVAVSRGAPHGRHPATADGVVPRCGHSDPGGYRGEAACNAAAGYAGLRSEERGVGAAAGWRRMHGEGHLVEEQKPLYPNIRDTHWSDLHSAETDAAEREGHSLHRERGVHPHPRRVGCGARAEGRVDGKLWGAWGLHSPFGHPSAVHRGHPGLHARQSQSRGLRVRRCGQGRVPNCPPAVVRIPLAPCVAHPETDTDPCPVNLSKSPTSALQPPGEPVHTPTPRLRLLLFTRHGLIALAGRAGGLGGRLAHTVPFFFLFRPPTPPPYTPPPPPR